MTLRVLHLNRPVFPTQVKHDQSISADMLVKYLYMICSNIDKGYIKLVYKVQDIIDKDWIYYLSYSH